MSESPSAAPTAQKSGRRAPRWLAFTIAVLFGLVYAYDVWEGIGNLVGLNIAAQGLDTRLSGFGFGVLFAGVLLPIAAYVLAAWFGRSRGAGAQAALFLVGLCVSAAFAIDIFMFGLGSLIV
jgi:hypothetical protein